jgi:hypothetical protein
MNDNNKSSKILSDDALERVMLDMFGSVWESSADKAQPETAEMDSLLSALIEESDGDI